MRLTRNIEIFFIILWVIFLGILITLLAYALLFWDKSGGKKSFLALVLMITFVLFRLSLLIRSLKFEASFYKQNIVNKIKHKKLARQERERINQHRDEITGQIDARLNRAITSNLFLMRLLHSDKIIGLFFFFITSFIFWFFLEFELRLSLIPGLIAAFTTGAIIRSITRYSMTNLFNQEFLFGSLDRKAAIEHLYQNRHAYWFASELLKTIR